MKKLHAHAIGFRSHRLRHICMALTNRPPFGAFFVFGAQAGIAADTAPAANWGFLLARQNFPG